MPAQSGHDTLKGWYDKPQLFGVGLLAELVDHVGHNVHDLGHQRAVLANRHHAHVVTLDHQERHRFYGGATARGRSVPFALVTAKAKAYGHTAHGNDGRIARLDRFTDDSLRLSNETELFQKSFCKFFDSHGLNIVIRNSEFGFQSRNKRGEAAKPNNS